MIEIFTTDYCPRCKMLKERLKTKGVEFKENTNEEEMVELGFSTVPMLRTEDNELLDFGQAISWINSL